MPPWLLYVRCCVGLFLRHVSRFDFRAAQSRIQPLDERPNLPNYDQEVSRCDLKMDELVPWLLIGLLVVGVIIYGNWLKQRANPQISSQDHCSVRLADQSDQDHLSLSWRWYQRFALFVVGAGLGGFAFCFILSGYLSPPRRPVLPDAPLGYTYFFEIKSHGVYGTYFEYLAMTYGTLTTWGIALVGCAIIAILKVNPTSRAYLLQIFAGAAISMALYYAVWRACIARS
jgi:hypothetical protein